MRVFMTGGYGCIGSWVAKQLVDAGQEVWIYDLKEDTHRLDLILEPEQKSAVHFLAGDVSDADALRSAVERSGRPISSTWRACKPRPARRTRSWARRSTCSGPWRSSRRHWPSRTRCAGSSTPAPRPCTARPTRTERPFGDVVRLAPLSHYGAFKVCNELNARVYWLDHGITSIGLRPWTVYGVGRDFGMTSEPTKAIKAAAVGRPYRISYGGRQDLQYVGDVAATFVRALAQPFEGADAFNLRGAVEPIEAFVAALLRRRARAPATLVTHGDRQLPIAADLDDSRLQSRLGPIPRTPLREGIAETFRRFVALRDQGRLDASGL